MKKLLLLSLCLTLGLLLSATSAMAFGGTWIPGTGINHTVHDMTDPGNAQYVANPPDAVGGRICIYCHTPHNAIRLSVDNGGMPTGTNGAAPDYFTYLPLWNHELTQLAGTYNGYFNGPGAPDITTPHGANSILAGQFSLAGSLQPGSTSLLCLSCHDGTVAVNSYGTGPFGGQVAPPGSYSTGGVTMNDQYVIGLDGNLQNHHPIGFDYDVVQSIDPDIREAATTDMSLYDGIYQTISDHLYQPSFNVGSCNSGECLECGSCHSVHNKGNTGERLLWRSDVNSQLCLTCHDKGTYTEPDGDPEIIAVPRP